MLLSLFGVSLGFALAYIIGNGPTEWLGLSTARPPGAAVAKLSEALPMYATIFLATYLARQSLGSLGLQKGRLWLSLGLGLLSAVPLLSWLPWIGLFSVANGFMEESCGSGSLWGAVLSHAIADVLFLLVAFGSRGGL